MITNTVKQSNEHLVRRNKEWYKSNSWIYNSWEFSKADEYVKKPQIPKCRKYTKPMKYNKIRNE